MVLGVGPRHSWQRVQWGCCWWFGVSVLTLLAASGVGAAPGHSSQRVLLVLLMVRVVDVMVLLMPMVLQVLNRLMPRVRALWVVVLRLGGGVTGVADGGGGAVRDAPGVADVEGALLAVLWSMVLLLMPLMRALQVMLRFTVSLVMMMMRCRRWFWCGSACGWSLACVWARAVAIPGWGPGGRRCWPVGPPVSPVGASGDADGEGAS